MSTWSKRIALSLCLAATGLGGASALANTSGEGVSQAATPPEPECWIDVYGDLERDSVPDRAQRTRPEGALSSLGQVVRAQASAGGTPAASSRFNRDAAFLAARLAALQGARLESAAAPDSQWWHAAVNGRSARIRLEKSDSDGLWRVAEEHIPVPAGLCRK